MQNHLLIEVQLVQHAFVGQLQIFLFLNKVVLISQYREYLNKNWINEEIISFMQY